MGRYFHQCPLEERKALWDKYLPMIQEQFTDNDYAVAKESFAEVFPDYMSMTEYEGLPFDPNDRSQVALANMFGWDDSHWDDWYDEGDAMKDTIPTIKSMLKKSDDMGEEYDSSDDVPTDEKAQTRERQRTRFGDKVTDEGGDSRLVHRANVADLRNFDQDINAPQGNVYDADKLKAPTRKSTGFRELVSRKTFEKTGLVPDVEFMDKYMTIQKTMYAEPTAHGSAAPIASYKEKKMKEHLMNQAEEKRHAPAEENKLVGSYPRGNPNYNPDGSLKRVYVGGGYGPDGEELVSPNNSSNRNPDDSPKRVYVGGEYGPDGEIYPSSKNYDEELEDRVLRFDSSAQLSEFIGNLMNSMGYARDTASGYDEFVDRMWKEALEAQRANRASTRAQIEGDLNNSSPGEKQEDTPKKDVHKVYVDGE